MNDRLFISVLVGLVVAIAIRTTAQTRTPAPGLQELIGDRVQSSHLQRRGYELQRTSRTNEESFAFWRQPQTGQCIIVRTRNDYYVSIMATEPSDCSPRTATYYTATQATTPSALQDLVNARVDQRDFAVERRGYTYRRGEGDSYTAITYWSEVSTNACVKVVALEGRYQTITYVEDAYCIN